MPDPNETPFCLASNLDLLNELTTRPTMAAVVVYVDRELKGDAPQPGDMLYVSNTPGITRKGVIGLLEMALAHMKSLPPETPG